jgi:catechol 2,3-dioxygenase-like lactoylglutathione lyase family enzyme
MTMKVRRLAWLGVRTNAYPETIRFFRDVLGLPVAFEEQATMELSLPNDDRIQVFGPGDRYYDFFGRFAAGLIPLFEVDELDVARAELIEAGLELIGDIESDGLWSWLHVRGPDGNLYELASKREQQAKSSQ